MSSQEIVHCENLSVELGGVSVLSDLSFSVIEGDFLAIVGPN